MLAVNFSAILLESNVLDWVYINMCMHFPTDWTSGINSVGINGNSFNDSVGSLLPNVV